MRQAGGIEPPGRNIDRDSRAAPRLRVDGNRAVQIGCQPSHDGETQTGGLPFVSKTSEFGTILSCIEKHLEESRTTTPAEEPHMAEPWELG